MLLLLFPEDAPVLPHLIQLSLCSRQIPGAVWDLPWFGESWPVSAGRHQLSGHDTSCPQGLVGAAVPAFPSRLLTLQSQQEGPQARQLLWSWNLPIPSQLRGVNKSSHYGRVSTSLWVLQAGTQGCKQLPDLFNTSLGTASATKYRTFHKHGEHFLKIKLFLILIISFL